MFTILALIVLVALGFWQLERLAWKEALIFERQSRSQAPVMTLADSVKAAEGPEFRAVRVRGRFLHDRELYLAARTLNGRVGLHVVTPLGLEDGRVLLVDRGWVPEHRRDPSTRAEGQVPGLLDLTGLVRLPGWKGPDWLKPDNLPAENLWFWVDPPAMAEAAGLAAVIAEAYIDAGPAENPGGLPLGGQTRIELPNDHLQYALTWFALAVTLLVIYLLYHLRRTPDEEGS